MICNDLIYNLQTLKENNSPLMNSVKNFDLLILALKDLNQMVEMEGLKDSIVKQIKYLIVSNNNEFHGHMLHTVLCGPPGVGKTHVCSILVRIWLGLGVLKIKPKPKLVNPFEDNFEDNPESNVNESNNEKPKKSVLTGYITSLITENYDLKEKQENTAKKLDHIKEIAHTIKQKLPAEKSGSFYDNINSQKNKTGSQLVKIITAVEEIKTNLLTTSSVDKIFPIFIKETIDVKTVDVQKSKTKDENMVKIVSREDFIGGFLGQTALKTEKLLNDSLGKVLFIDEAYSLVNDEKDSYGREALTVLNRFMSEHPDEIVVIFAGYKNLMEETIFKFQPGLKSRCTWIFEIDGYTESGLATIFKQQINKNGWTLEPSVDLNLFFKTNKDFFTAYGRDTNRLVFYCKLCYSEYIFDTNSINTNVITENILNKALVYMKNNKILNISEDKTYLSYFM